MGDSLSNHRYTKLVAGKKVLVSPKWIDRIDWSQSKIFINLSGETIKKSPEFTDDSLLSRDYETLLHKYYKHKEYRVDELVVNKHSN